MSYVTIAPFIALLVFVAISTIALACFCYWLYSRLEQQKYVCELSETSLPHVLSDINSSFVSARESIRSLKEDQKVIIRFFHECRAALYRSPTFNDYANAIEKDEKITELYKKLEPDSEIKDIHETTQITFPESSKEKVY